MICRKLRFFVLFLASQDALEVMYVSQSADRDSTDVTLVSEDTNRKLYLCDSGE